MYRYSRWVTLVRRGKRKEGCRGKERTCLTLGETHQAVDGIVGRDETNHAVDNSCEGATKKTGHAREDTGALLGVVLLETALDLGAGLRVVEEGVETILLHPGEGEHGRRACQGGSQYSRGLHSEGWGYRTGGREWMLITSRTGTKT